MIVFCRVTDLAEGKPANVSPEEWDRLTAFEREWLGVDGREWMQIQGFDKQQLEKRFGSAVRQETVCMTTSLPAHYHLITGFGGEESGGLL